MSVANSFHLTFGSELNLEILLISASDFWFFWEKAKENLQRSAVADNDNGESQVSDVRTSSGTFISKGKVKFLLLRFHFLSLEVGTQNWTLQQISLNFSNRQLIFDSDIWKKESTYVWVWISDVDPDKIGSEKSKPPHVSVSDATKKIKYLSLEPKIGKNRSHWIFLITLNLWCWITDLKTQNLWIRATLIMLFMNLSKVNLPDLGKLAQNCIDL